MEERKQALLTAVQSLRVIASESADTELGESYSNFLKALADLLEVLA